jgi:hypothetical protein
MQPAAKESARRIGFWRFTTRQSPGGAPDTKTERRHDFIPYPVRRVVGTIANAQQADATVEALADAGFERHDIDVLHGEEGLRRLDPADTEPGLLAQFQRSFVRSVGDCEETSLERHTQELRAGKFVIMVRAKSRDRRKLAAEILNAHGSESIRYCGRWIWEWLDVGPAGLRRRMAPERAPSQMYEVDFDGASIRLRFQSGASAIVTGAGRAASHATVMGLRPGLNMLTWKSPDGMSVVQVHDYESSRAYAVLTERDGSVRRLKGTIRRLS